MSLLLSFDRTELKKRTHRTIVAEMPSLPFAWLRRSPFQLSRLFRELEQDVEMVVKVLQPGRLGIVEHKFSAEEIQEAKTTVERSIENWRRIAALEKHGHVVRGGEK
eukprot:TRINITY_DN13189_c1_g2_i4.p1 TRINITY_DN13189_c1_g2~~TRINITY_DN13189_c1_g2_i4.p1  ORF type:complete len:107 (+),score=24.47 TRINITY_DN13189_c1_g2_i4:1826-2146(+)